MTNQQIHTNRTMPGLFFSLLLILLSLYMATYSGFIESRDALRVLDATSSLVHYGDLLRDETGWQDVTADTLTGAYSFGAYEANEWIMPYLVAVPYLLADTVPQFGYVHTSWLLNIITMALTCLVFFKFAQDLGYSQRTAFISALVLGTGTILWIYSKTLFREPVTTLLLFTVAWMLYRWRQAPSHFWWLMVGIITFVCAVFVENAAILSLPAFIALLIGRWEPTHKYGRILDGLFIAGLLLLIAMSFSQAVVDLVLIPLSGIISGNMDFVQVALHSYLFSIGGSIWGTSPVLVLGIAGAIMLIQQRQRSLVWMVCLLVSGYAVGHALLTFQHWFGGTSHPPRFLLPAVPFAMLLTLPVIDKLIQPDTNRLLKIIIAGIVGFSVIIQAIVSVSLTNAYPGLLPLEANGLVEWLPGLNDVRYLRWVLLPQSWASLGYDVAWARIDIAWLSIGFLLISAFAGIIALTSVRFKWLINSVLALVLVAITAFGLTQLHQRDRLYWATTPELFEVLSILEAEASPNETLFLAGAADVTYEKFIMNYYSLQNPRPVVLGFQPGERASERVEPQITTPYNILRLNRDSLRVIDHISLQQNQIWWLAHNSPFASWTVRPEERYLSETYYLLDAYPTTNPDVRLYTYSTVSAPSRTEFRFPEYGSTLQFGDHISLSGYTLPLATQYAAGDIVPITFFWESDAVLTTDYTVSWFIVNPEAGVIEQGVDSVPDAGFTPTTTWQPERFVYDNRAIKLPADAPAGEYQIWVRLYVTGSGGTDQLPVSGGETYEDTTAILPITLTITEPVD